MELGKPWAGKPPARFDEGSEAKAAAQPKCLPPRTLLAYSTRPLHAHPMSEENKIRDTIEAATGLVQAIPIYQDAIQPAAKEIGGALQTVAKAIHVALAPVSTLVWGYDQIKEFVHSRVAEKLKSTPPEDIQPPKPNIAGPALEALRYTGHEPTLRELYANLLAASLDKQTAKIAHPAFVELIKQLSPDEARLMQVFAFDRPFPIITVRAESNDAGKGGKDVLPRVSLLGFEAGCQHPELTPAYLDNLCRLGLLDIPQFMAYTDPNIYKQLEEHPQVASIRAQIDATPEQKSVVTRQGAFVTQLGRQFIFACVIDHEQLRATKAS